MVEFFDFTIAHDEDFVALNDGLESMSNGDHGTVLEALLDHFLDLVLGDEVNVGSSFIEDYNFALLHDSSADANDSFLTRAEVATLLVNVKTKKRLVFLLLLIGLLLRFTFLFSFLFFLLLLLLIFLVDDINNSRLIEDVKNFFICALIEWVKVVSEGSLEKSWLLWDDGDLVSELSNANL